MIGEIKKIRIRNGLSDEKDIKDYFITENKDALVELKLIGEGATTQAWFVETPNTNFSARIVKSVKMNDSNGLNNREDALKEFLRQRKIIEDIYSLRTKEEHANEIMISHPQLHASSIGPVYITDSTAYVGNDATLRDYVAKANEIKNHEERMKRALVLAKKILEELRIYHEKDYIHFDVKPGNFLKINFEKNMTEKPESYIIRNLDFGSCIYTSDINNSIAELKEKYQKGTEVAYNDVIKLQQTYCKSTPAFYPTKKTEERLKELFTLDSEAEIKNGLFDLDVDAVFRIIKLFYFDTRKNKNGYGTTLDQVKELKNCFFNSEIPKSFRDYNLYYKFSNLLFNSKVWNDGHRYKSADATIKYIDSILAILEKNSEKEDGLESLALSNFDYLLRSVDEQFKEVKPRESDWKRKIGQYSLKLLAQNAMITPIDLVQNLLFE